MYKYTFSKEKNIIITHNLFIVLFLLLLFIIIVTCFRDSLIFAAA